MQLRPPAFTSALAVLLALPLVAHAEDSRPHGTYVWYQPPEGLATPEAPATGTAESHASNVIYLNPCWGNCTINRGYPDDSRSNKSSIPRASTSTVSEFRFGQETFDAVAACVRDMYEPFNIEIVTEDPGNAPHFEAIVAGTPDEVGMGNNVGGVSPFSCDIIDNAITYTFANIYGGSVQQICEVIAQETAHAFGLEHEYLCEDPMTYLSGCGAKTFHDVDAQCGEYSARACYCGGSSQNSVQMITAEFGPGVPTPPTVTINDPQEGDTLQPGFPVRAEAMDNASVDRVELWINGVKKGELTGRPYAFNAPDDIGQGNVTIEVRAFDNRDTMGSAQVNAVLGAPCGGNKDCGDGEVCVEGRCVDGPDSPGGLGQPCQTQADCDSGICANDGVDKFCVEKCASACPGGFECTAAGADSVCWPSADGGGGGSGGCAAGGDGAGAPIGFLLALALGGMIFRRRRVA